MKEKIKELLAEYLDAPEAWGDNVMIEVNPANGGMRLSDDEEVDVEHSELDYWPVMDLLQMSLENPGEWEIDEDSVEEMAGAY
ncbi:MAG: hypothetical protein NC095_11940 [Muribaculum sp.]|nr:hypothetical protein [Muribaculum sp.]